MAHKDKLGTDSRGVFRRYIGWKEGNGDRAIQHLFRLGRDREKAQLANSRLETLWQCVEHRWCRLKDEGKAIDPCPFWDATTLQLGNAIAKGETSCTVQPPPGLDRASAPQLAVLWLAELQADFPVIALRLPDEVLRPGVESLNNRISILDKQRQRYAGMLEAVGQPSASTLHQALDAFAAHLQEREKGKAGLRWHLGRIDLLKRYSKDESLGKLTADRIETWVAFWSRRPLRDNGQPFAWDTCRTVCVMLRAFLRWLSRSPEYDWTLPAGFVFRPEKTTILPADRTKSRQHYTLEELAILWKYAPPYVRALMFLALNCGFAKREIATLQKQEIVTGKRYTFIKRRRTKTDVYAEWVLWPETVEALDHLRHYQGDSPYAVCNEAGKPMGERMPCGADNNQIGNRWRRLLAKSLSE